MSYENDDLLNANLKEKQKMKEQSGSLEAFKIEVNSDQISFEHSLTEVSKWLANIQCTDSESILYKYKEGMEKFVINKGTKVDDKIDILKININKKIERYENGMALFDKVNTPIGNW